MRPCITAIPLLFILFWMPVAVNAQHTLSGKLADRGSGEPLRGAHITLLDEDGAMVKATISDGSGQYSLTRLAPGSYVIRFTFVGYDPGEMEWEVPGSGPDLGTRYMVLSATELEGARVTGNVPMAAQIGDTTQFNADAFTTTPDATAEELVEKMPGVVVQDGKVEAMGEKVEQVLVDGRPFFRNDPTAALKTLPAEVIDKIQVFDKESDQAEFTGFSDGETVKTMNIITRTGMRNGTFGKLTAGTGTGEGVWDGTLAPAEGALYMAGGNVNFFNGPRRITLVGQTNNVNEQNFSTEDLLGVMASGSRRMGGGAGAGMGAGRSGGMGGRMPGTGGFGGGSVSEFLVAQQPGISTTHSLGVNYSDLWGEKVDVTGSYFFNFSDNDSREELNRIYTVGSDSGQHYTESSASESRNINHRFHMRMEYTLDENNSLMIRPRLTLQQNAGNASLLGETTRNGVPLNSLASDQDSELSALSFSNTLLFRHRFTRERRTLSVNLTTLANRQEGENGLGSTTFPGLGGGDPVVTDQQGMLAAAGWGVSGNLMYTEPLGERGMMQFHYRASYQEDDSDKRTFGVDPAFPGYSEPDTMLSSVFYNQYLTQRAGAGYMVRMDRLFLTGRVEYQHASLLNRQTFPSGLQTGASFSNVLWTAIARYRPSRGRNISLVYRTSTTPPSIFQLQEVVDNSNPVQLQTGNSSLDPSYSHHGFLRFSSVDPETSRVFFLMLNGRLTSGYIGNQTLFARGDTLLEGGIFLPAGSQLTRPVNLDGYGSFRTFVTYGIPVRAIRSNLNLNLGYTYIRTPGQAGGVITYSNSHSTTLGLVASSNFSEFLDFTLSSRTGYHAAVNSRNTSQDFTYLDQRTRFRFKGVTPSSGFLLETLLTHRLTRGLSGSFDQDNWIWSAALGKKLFPNRLGEIKLGVHDILGQGQNISRQVSDIYIEDSESNLLRRYFMLTFTYNLRQFSPPGDGPDDDMRHRMMRIREEME